MPHIGPHVTLNDPAYIHDTVTLYGKVTIGPGASIWPQVVMRAEMFEIRIGARTNIQDFVMVHALEARLTGQGLDQADDDALEARVIGRGIGKCRFRRHSALWRTDQGIAPGSRHHG